MGGGNISLLKIALSNVKTFLRHSLLQVFYELPEEHTFGRAIVSWKEMCPLDWWLSSSLDNWYWLKLCKSGYCLDTSGEVVIANEKIRMVLESTLVLSKEMRGEIRLSIWEEFQIEFSTFHGSFINSRWPLKVVRNLMFWYFNLLLISTWNETFQTSVTNNLPLKLGILYVCNGHCSHGNGSTNLTKKCFQVLFSKDLMVELYHNTSGLMCNDTR